MTELEVICRNCGRFGSMQRFVDDIRPYNPKNIVEYPEKYKNAYLCWSNGARDWWEMETKTVIGICPKCLKKDERRNGCKI